MIPYGRQEVTQDDIDSVVEVLKSDFLTQGPVVPAFESSIKKYCSVNYAIASNSATSSLHAACFALDVGPGDIVWTVSNTFVASSNCAIYCGASIDFVDIDSTSYNLSIASLKKKLSKAKKYNKLPKVLIPVHLCGLSCEMKEISELSKKYGFKIIEDASHAIGGEYLNKKIGSCEYSDITVFSFHPVKIITTGEGGVATTNCSKLAKKMELFRSHGITRDKNLMKKQSDGPWYYEQIELGYNYRMTDIQAALGLSQIDRLDENIKIRHHIADKYNEKLSSLPIQLPSKSSDSYSSFHLYVIRLDLKKISHTHKEVFEYLRNKKILVNLHYIPVYFHPFYEKFGFKKGYCPESEKYYSDALSIPIFPTLSSVDQSIVIEELCNIIK